MTAVIFKSYSGVDDRNLRCVTLNRVDPVPAGASGQGRRVLNLEIPQFRAILQVDRADDTLGMISDEETIDFFLMRGRDAGGQPDANNRYQEALRVR